MEYRDHIKKYLLDGRLIQLATASDDKPWVCSVYYVVDSALNVYWLSYPTRRHSIDIAVNPHAAVTLAVRHDFPVIGLQAEGEASKVTNLKTVIKIMTLYIAKYGAGKSFYKNFKLGINKHALYRFTPSRFALFDEVNYAKESPVEITIRQ